MSVCAAKLFELQKIRRNSLTISEVRAVKRNLFGTPTKEDRLNAELELKRKTEESCKVYNFDFNKGRPMVPEPGQLQRFAWSEPVPSLSLKDVTGISLSLSPMQIAGMSPTQSPEIVRSALSVSSPMEISSPAYPSSQTNSVSKRIVTEPAKAKSKIKTPIARKKESPLKAVTLKRTITDYFPVCKKASTLVKRMRTNPEPSRPSGSEQMPSTSP